MPKPHVNTTGQQQQRNGKPHSNGEARAAALAKALRGTDTIEIGGSMEVDPDVRAATMADAAKLIASVRYLVRGWIPFGMITGLIAEPGVGKSAFALWLARSIMTGKPWFTGRKGPSPSHVLWCSTENDMAITNQRLTKWRIPTSKLLLPFKDDPLASVNLLDDEHLARIEQLVCRYKPLAVFIDSLRGAHDTDENNSRVGKVLQNLGAIAERTKAAVIVVHHSRELEVGGEISANSSRGSNAILALFRAQLGFDKPDPDSPWTRVRMLKENLGLAPEPFGMRVTDKGLEFGEPPTKPDKETQKAKAAEWLRTYLKDGKWHLRNNVMTDAAQFDLSANAIQRAREELGITVESPYIRKRSSDGLYEWRLPSAGVNSS